MYKPQIQKTTTLKVYYSNK